MLSLAFDPTLARRTDNLLPDARALLRTRPGLVQVSALPALAAEWAAGALWVLTETGDVTVLGPGPAVTPALVAGVPALDVQPLQVLTGGATRADRVYVADAVNGLWYAKRAESGWERASVVNTVTDGGGAPYPIPLPRALAAWRGRLWVADGSNRIQHAGLEDPAEWNPLWTLECQGPQQDTVRALLPVGDRLLVGLRHSLWAVAGWSQYDWAVTQVAERGVLGPRALVTDGEGVFAAGERGVFELGTAAPLTADVLDVLFDPPDPTAALMLSADGRLLYLAAHGRCLVWHRSARRWGEVLLPDGARLRGLARTEQGVVLVGDSGCWLSGAHGAPDAWLDGRRQPVVWALETWPAATRAPDGHAVLDEVIMVLRGGAA